MHAEYPALTVWQLLLACAAVLRLSNKMGVKRYLCYLRLASSWRSQPARGARGSGDIRIIYLCQSYRKHVRPIRSFRYQLMMLFPLYPVSN